jgi:hypothetical protein
VDCSCGQALDGAALFEAVAGYTGSTNRLLAGKCPVCGSPFEVRASRDRFEWGFTYFGAALHFESLVDVAAPGLVVSHPEPEEILLHLDGRERRLIGPEEGIEWFAVFPGAAVAGRTLADAGFHELGVRVEEIQRDGGRLSGTADTVLQLGDRLLFRGTPAARRKVWALMHAG